jgi:hypothetical protein
MTDQLVTALVTIVVAIIGLASLSVILSPKAATSQVIQAGSSGLAQNISAAISPVTGGSGFSSFGGMPGNGF